MRSDLVRQSALVPESILDTPITIVGAGAIGSWTCLSLAKMGFENIRVYDDDEVAIENLSSQFFRRSDIGKPKVLALKEMVEEFTGVDIDAINGRFSNETGISNFGIVVSAVDSMQSRRAIYQSSKNSPSRFLIDPRMGAESALLYVCKITDSQDKERYEKTFYSDSDAVQERCTAKATIFTANMLSGLVCKTLRDVLVGDGYKWHCVWSIKHDDFMAFHSQNQVPL